jgi:hypothetical protein
MIAIRRPAKQSLASPALTTSHALLTDTWTADVNALQAALGRIRKGAGLNSDCRVTFFEVAEDGHLHVSVTHGSTTGHVNGWSGPGSRPEGVVHTRAFSRVPRYQVLRQIREMVFTAPDESSRT